METQRNHDTRQRSYLIADLCSEFEVTPRALRFYEQRGLVGPARRGTTRLYSHRDRVRLQLILRGKRFGFSLIEIREMLDLYDQRNGAQIQLQTVLPKLQRQLEILRQDHDELAAAIADLENDCQHLKDALHQRQQAE